MIICLAAVPLMFVDFWLDENKYNQNMRQYCTYALRNSLKYFYATNKLANDMKDKGELSTTLQGKLTDRLLAREKDRLKHEGLIEQEEIE